MPAPPRTPTKFLEILEQIWWRLDVALDLEMIRASALLGALEAIEAGTTAIFDHHESPNAIEGSLDVIAEACAEVGVRVVCAYGVTDRHGAEGTARGLAENERFIRGGGSGLVGIHAAFTCSPATIERSAGLAIDLGVGVHVHVAEGIDDADAASRLSELSTDDWLLAHCVHLDESAGMRGTVIHNPRSNMNNAVGYANPARFSNPVGLGSDGIGASMLDEFQIAYFRSRDADLSATPDTSWSWLATGWDLVPEARSDLVTWSYDGVDDPWRLAFTPGVHAVDVEIDGETVLKDAVATRVDPAEIRCKAKEQATRLFALL